MGKNSKKSGNKATKQGTTEVPGQGTAVHQEEPLPETSEGSADAYERFIQDAMALAAGKEIPTFRGDPVLAFHNVKDGVAAVMAHKERLKKELPTLDLAPLEALPALADAVLYADSRAVAMAGKKSDVAALRTEARGLRRFLLLSADALVAAGLVESGRVEKIRAGSGLTDMAQDCLDLVALFRDHRALLKGKTAVTSAQLEAADRVGRALRNAVRPSTSRAVVSPSAPPEVTPLDALGYLLRQRHTDLWRAGAWLFGPAVDQHVPPLYARKHKPRTPPTPPAT